MKNGNPDPDIGLKFLVLTFNIAGVTLLIFGVVQLMYTDSRLAGIVILMLAVVMLGLTPAMKFLLKPRT